MRAWNEKTRSQIIPWERGRRTKRPLRTFHSRVIHLWVYVAVPIHTYTYMCVCVPKQYGPGSSNAADEKWKRTV